MKFCVSLTGFQSITGKMAAMANNSVEVSVEALGEYQIQEVTIDGQEIYTQLVAIIYFM